MKVSLFDLLLIYETEVKKNVRNKKKILDFEKHKMEYLVDIKNVLENNLYDGYVFNAPLLERLSIIAIFKDPRQVANLSCCNFTDADNLTWIATETKQSLIKKKLAYYRQYYPQPQQNNQVPQ